MMLDLLTKSDAVISDCGKYRYRLSRTWGDEKPAVFVMLNPSTADASEDDPTIRRCIGFAQKWGCGGLVVVNLFAYRATSPKDMISATNPVGTNNSLWVLKAAQHAQFVVCAWGANGTHQNQDAKIIECLRRCFKTHIYCLGTTKGGQPKHPLYLSANTELQPYPSDSAPNRKDPE